jgi:hypothetical protein
MILKRILKCENVTARSGLNWLKIGCASSSCKHGNEITGSIKDEEFLD